MPWLNRHTGVMLMDKPSGMTSHDMVYAVRRTLEQQEVGHTGTLDPLATGLLVICVGRATKIAQFISNLDKTYVASVRLGLRSSTYDAEGVAMDAVPRETSTITREQVERLLDGFVGTQKQQVPAHSAVKINGQHLYELARKGHDMELPEREVTISHIQLLDFKESVARFEVTCSKGTYIRTLAHQIGEHLGCGGYLAGLRRTKVGPFSIENALTIEQMSKAVANNDVDSILLPISRVLQFGAVCIQDEFRMQVGYGRTPAWNDISRVEGVFDAGDRVMIKSLTGEVLAVGIAGSSSHGFEDHAGQPVASYVRVLA